MPKLMDGVMLLARSLSSLNSDLTFEGAKRFHALEILTKVENSSLMSLRRQMG